MHDECIGMKLEGSGKSWGRENNIIKIHCMKHFKSKAYRL